MSGNGIEVLSRTQRIIVLPNTSVSIVKEGPPGPPGPPGLQGIPGPSGSTGSSGSAPMYNTISNRPSPVVAGNRALFVDIDTRFIYQVQLGAWVKVGGGGALGSLTDVDISDIQDQDLLGWSTAQGKFVPTGFEDAPPAPAGPVGPAGAAGPSGPNGVTEVVTGFAGPVSTASGGRYYAPITGTTATATCSVAIAGTTDTIFTIKKNGVILGTVTLGSGVNKIGVVFTTGFTQDTDYFTAEITTAGINAFDATIQLRLT